MLLLVSARIDIRTSLPQADQHLFASISQHWRLTSIRLWLYGPWRPCCGSHHTHICFLHLRTQHPLAVQVCPSSCWRPRRNEVRQLRVERCLNYSVTHDSLYTLRKITFYNVKAATQDNSNLKQSDVFARVRGTFAHCYFIVATYTFRLFLLDIFEVKHVYTTPELVLHQLVSVLLPVPYFRLLTFRSEQMRQLPSESWNSRRRGRYNLDACWTCPWAVNMSSQSAAMDVRDTKDKYETHLFQIFQALR